MAELSSAGVVTIINFSEYIIMPARFICKTADGFPGKHLMIPYFFTCRYHKHPEKVRSLS